MKLLLQYIIKLKANPDNPAFRCVFHPQFENLYDKNKNCIKAVGLRIKKHLQDSNLPLDIVKPSTLSEIPPWKLRKPKVDISLSELKKSETNSVVFKENNTIKIIRNCNLYRWFKRQKQSCSCCSDQKRYFLCTPS